jgi:hypothetical protein
MKSHRFVRVLKFLPLVLLFVALLGLLVMALWNWLMPAVLGVKAIGYWQALGLVILCRILFGGHRGPSHDGIWRHRFLERWERMTPEERERFRQGFHDRWGRVTPPDSPPSP